ncbi:unnamed protein product [Orchesella dallaii]|uniref:Protein kinase domain-containing protein n=1 Tax=Orchesella dallaii TaxID=48710 RepID=A0ABP1QB25_9HEXA
MINRKHTLFIVQQQPQSESITLEIAMGNESSKETAKSSSVSTSTTVVPVTESIRESAMIPTKKGSLTSGTTSIVVQVVHQNEHGATTDDVGSSGKYGKDKFLEARSRFEGTVGESKEKAGKARAPKVPIENTTLQKAQVVKDDYSYETDQLEGNGEEDSNLNDNEEFEDQDDRDSDSDSKDEDDAASSVGGEEGEERRRPVSFKVFDSSDLRCVEHVGDGGFGRVVLGNLHGTRVAVKIFHSPIKPEDFHSNVGALARLRHRNVASIMGIMTNVEMDGSEIVLNYFPEGNVVNFLKRRGSSHDYGLLRKLSLDIADGCEHLHKKNVVHGNLAGRNILVEKVVSAQKVYYNAKIADFGLIGFAECTGGNYFKVGSKGKMVPIRWAPKELVVDDETQTDFTFASDIWSFGVVLWEMWSKGNLPFGTSTTNLKVLQLLKDGYSPVTLHRPNGCPALMTEIMEDIFKVNPTERPDFSQIKQKLKNFRGNGSRKKIESKPDEAPLGKGLHGKLESDPLVQQQTALDKTQKKKQKKNRANNATDAIGENDAEINAKITDKGHGVSREDDVGSTESAKKSQAPAVRKPNPNFHPNPGKVGNDTPQPHPKKPEKGGNKHDETAGQRSQQYEKKSGSQGRPNTHQSRQFTRGGRQNLPDNRRGTNRSRSRNFQDPSVFNVNASFADPSVGGASSMVMPPAPPPYTPNPLPNHSSAFLPSPGGFSAPLEPNPLGRQHQGSEAVVKYDGQIKQLQGEIERLKTERDAQELQQKFEELTEVMRRMTAQKISSMGVGDANQQHQPPQNFDMSRGPRFNQHQPYGPKGRGRGNGRGRGGSRPPYQDKRPGNPY